MDTRPRVEHYSPGPNRMPSPGSKPDPERPNFYFGADHGRMERQVAVQISLTDDFTPDQIANAHKVLRDATEKVRSEEHTSELQSLMRISYAVFCLQKTTHKIQE